MISVYSLNKNKTYVKNFSEFMDFTFLLVYSLVGV